MLAILCFHRVLPSNRRQTNDEPYFIRQTALELDNFRRLLDQLQQSWEPLPPDQLLPWYEGHSALSRPTFLITFDDGYADVYEHAFPELKSRGLKAILAVTTAVVEGIQTGFPVDHWYATLMEARRHGLPLMGTAPEAWTLHPGVDSDFQRLIDGPEKRAFLNTSAPQQAAILYDLRRSARLPSAERLPPFLRVPQLQALVKAGWLLASHGHTHALLPTLAEAQAREELALSRDWFSAQGFGAPELLAWPDGAMNAQTAQLAEGCGYRLGLGLGGRLATRQDSPWQLARLIPRNSASWFEDRLQPLFQSAHAELKP